MRSLPARLVASLGAVSVCAIVACSAGDSTGFRYVPSSLVLSGFGSAVVRVYDDTERMAFCGTYAIDEARAPGETMSLVAFPSTLTIAPTDVASGRVRVVLDVFAAGVVPDVCESGIARTKPLAKKVAIARYAEGRVLDLRTVIEPSCLGVVECDERTSTCERGQCVDATRNFATGSVDVSECFDITACPNLERMAQVSTCTYRAPVPIGPGYVAATYVLPADGAGASRTTGVAVLEPGDFTVEGDRVTLTGRLCQLATDGYVDTLYFGFACAPPEAGRPVCVVADPGVIDRVVDIVVPGPDASVSTNDATTDAVPDARGDARGDGPDGTNDGTVGTDGAADGSDAASDGAVDGGASDARDDGAGRDGGLDGGSDSGGLPDFGLAAGASVMCPTPNPGCSTALTGLACCVSSMAACVQGAACAAFDTYRCDDRNDCEPGKVCCRRRTPGNSIESSCLTPIECGTALGGSELCTQNDGRCTSGVCTQVRTTPGGFECVPSTPVAHVRCDREAALPVDCTGAAPVCCMGTAPLERTCVATPSNCEGSGWFSCDETRDCPFGQVCCALTETFTSATCMTEQNCKFTAFGDVICSDEDPRCPAGTACTGVRLGVGSRYCQ